MNQASVLTASTSPRHPEIRVARVPAWFLGGLRLWGRSPFLLVALALGPFVLEAALQFSVPLAGVLLSKWLTPVVMGGQYIAIDRLAQGGRARLRDLLAGFRVERLVPLLTLGALLLVIFATQVLVAWLAYGPPVLDEVVLGHFGKYPALSTAPFLLTLILPGLVPAMILAFAMPLVVLEGRAPLEGVVLSARRVTGAPLAFAVFTLITGAMLVASLVLPFVGLPLLLLSSTWALTTSYVAYRDVFG